MSEWTTRKQLIDPGLEAAGWSSIVRYTPGAIYDTGAVEEYETAEGPTDTILFHCGEALPAVRADKLSLGPQNVLVQVQRYSRGLQGGAFNFHGSWARSPRPQRRTRPHSARSHSGQVEEGSQWECRRSAMGNGKSDEECG
jgi:hypothetical protein